MSLFVNAPIWMSLMTWAQGVTQQNVTPPSTAWQKIAKVGKRQVTARGFCATEYCTFYLMVVLVRQKAGQPLSSRSLCKSHEVYSYVEAEDILLSTYILRHLINS